MSPEAIARAAADRLAPRLGRRFPAAVDRALAVATPADAAPPAALDGIAAWLVRAARALEDADRREPQAAVERLFHALGRPDGASPAIGRAVLAALIDAATPAADAA